MDRHSKLNTVLILDIGDRRYFGVGNREQAKEIEAYIKRRVAEEYAKPENIGSDWVVPLVFKETGEKFIFNGCGVHVIDMTEPEAWKVSER